ncbi:DNA-directed RNA polymerase II subunit rpb7 [Seiridium cupressi]
MFFLYTLERRVTLHPSYFGKNMHELVTGKLLSDVEGTCTGSYYIITIMDTFDISEGRILPGSGLAEFTVRYKAVVWRPFKGETIDAIVVSVNQHGFFAEAGPLRIFVSSHLIPSDTKWDPNATPPEFTNGEDMHIRVGTHTRIKLLGTRAEVGELWAIGSIKEDYLGYVIPPHTLQIHPQVGWPSVDTKPPWLIIGSFVPSGAGKFLFRTCGHCRMEKKNSMRVLFTDAGSSRRLDPAIRTGDLSHHGTDWSYTSFGVGSDGETSPLIP